MTIDPLDLVDEVERAHTRLLSSAKGLDSAAISAPSPLPGWTRGHVLTHIARNADSLVNLLTWARTGVVTPQYPNHEVRNADIEAGSGRPPAEQYDDLEAASAKFVFAARAMPAEAWTVKVGDYPLPAANVVWRRLKETEIHHVDLDAGYRPADWPESFTLRLLRMTAADYADREDAPSLVLRCADIDQSFTIGSDPSAPVISGPSASLIGWLIGRSDGADLTVDPPGPLPPVPPLG